ncbi:MAG: hypothetical protein CMK59_05785 [Proteobacteria bacterium]|nr:hypothetical protein [Pseudomonadota bacterium]
MLPAQARVAAGSIEESDFQEEFRSYDEDDSPFETNSPPKNLFKCNFSMCVGSNKIFSWKDLAL